MNAAVGCYAAVIGLGSMGMGMARALRRAWFDVVGCDANPAAVEQFVRLRRLALAKEPLLESDPAHDPCAVLDLDTPA
jgi:3-hydroxyisobutyrate dehydrogenase-like beta-hydroxyacid dehydrogenase